MKELVVCSGKGGTGKTSVTATLAALAENPVLADCDVDAADLHLVISPRDTVTTPFEGGHLAVIKTEECEVCMTCRQLCRFGAIHQEVDEMGFPVLRVDSLHCEGCGVCVHFCPAEAIAFPRAVHGAWYSSTTDHGPLVHARLTPGEENSGKLVTLVREEARKLARTCQADLVLIDGPPGIGCPTTAALTGADLLLAVTEPGVSGRHDLDRLLTLAEHFEVPVAVCINKADINPEFTTLIEEDCRHRGVTLVGNVPFDPAITRAQLASRSVVEVGDGPAATALHTVWKNLKQLLNATNQGEKA